MTVANPVLNTPRHPWYERRNHVRIPRMAESRLYLDAAFVGGGGAWTEAGFPSAIFGSAAGYYFDPLDPANTVVSDGSGGAPVQGGPVGRIAGINPTQADTTAIQATAGARPLLVTKGGKPGFACDGVDDFLGSTVGLGDWLTLPRSTTMFAMLWRDTAVPAGVVNGFAISRGEVSNSYLRPFGMSSSLGMYGRMTFGGAIFVNNVTVMAPGAIPVGQWIEAIVELTITEMSVAGVGASSGSLTYWFNDDVPVSVAVSPDRASTASITSFNRIGVGAVYNSVSPAQFWDNTVGRCGVIFKALSAAERGQLRNWMRGTTYVAP